MKIKLFLILIFASTVSAVNVALYKPAEAALEYNDGGYNGLAAYAVDGDFLTRWNAGVFAPPVQSLTIDLLNNYSVNQIDLWTNTLEGFAGLYLNYDLYVSTDKAAWQFISSDTLVDTLDPHRVAVFSPLIVRYVRYDVTGGTHWAHLNEIQVYDVPEPATFLLLSLGGLILRNKM